MGSKKFYISQLLPEIKSPKNIFIENLHWDTRQAEPNTLVIPPVDFFFPAGSIFEKTVLDQYLKECWKTNKGSSKQFKIKIEKALNNLDSDSVLLCPFFFKNLAGNIGEDKIIYCHEYLKSSARICSVFFGQPDYQIHIVGVTGTNGKTSITHILQNYTETLSLNMKSAALGTMGLKLKGPDYQETGFTSPPLVQLYQILDKLVRAGTSHLFIELSSHGQVLGRFYNLALDGLILASLSSDHLDFHGNVNAYTQAKVEIVNLLIESPKNQKILVSRCLNAPEASLITNLKSSLQQSNVQIRLLNKLQMPENISRKLGNMLETQNLGFFSEEVAITLKDLSLRISNFEFNQANLSYDFSFSPGVFFYGMNIALCILYLDKAELMNKQKSWPRELKTIPGRFEMLIVGAKKIEAIIDYAHTPDALENLLFFLATFDSNHIVLVFGCGGDRDKSKRPLMGKVAAKYAKVIIITNDNPRNEDPQTIAEAICAPLQPNQSEIVLDRRAAIKRAYDLCNDKSILVVAGKGHESYQIINDVKHEFSDRIELQAIQ